MAKPRCENAADGETPRTLMVGGVEEQLPDLRRVWSLTFGDPRVCIAVLDGPAELAHPAFDGALLRQVEFPGGVKTARGLGLRHGTHVASLIFGQQDGPVRGVAPKCRGVVIPIYREQDDGTLVPCSQLDLARAISLAVAVGANVINISAGVHDETGEPEPPLARAIRLCEDQGILIVAAAGNEGCACPHVPAASPTVLAVGAADGAGNPLDFSNWSELYRGHGVLAPGHALAGAAPGGQTQRASGTSMAAALVSGVAGLLASWQLRLGRNIDVRAIKTAILTGAVRCEETAATDCQRSLGGRLHASTAFALISQGEASAMSNSNLPETSVHSPCMQGSVGEGGPAEGGGRGARPPSLSRSRSRPNDSWSTPWARSRSISAPQRGAMRLSKPAGKR
ncbi:MAG: S8 family serine peptidase [Pirellulaceae bacterium]|nr:S8 family serine peptidase [Pirellulaceae bacterium]